MNDIQLGEVAITRVVEIDRSFYPTASMLPDSTPDAVARHHGWIRPHFFDERTGDIGSRIQSYVVRTPRRTVIVDTGVGNDKARHESPVWNMRRGSYLEDLAATGAQELGGMQEQAETAQRLMATGRQGTATVTALRDTGVTINENPQIELDLDVTVEGMPTYPVTHRQVISRLAIAGFQPGATVPVRVDPQQPRSLIIA